MNLKERAKQLKADIPAVFLALRDRETPVIAKAFAARTIKFIPDEVWKRCRAEVVDLWKDGKPKKWYYAIPIILIWLILLWLIVKANWL